MTTVSRAAGPVVAFEGVTHAYGDSVAVRDVDLSIERGEFFALLGPSGSGKTTLLMLIAGFERATTGTIRLNGRQVSDVPAHLRNIGVVFQDYALFPHLTVWDNVDFPLRSRGLRRADRRERVAWALDLVQLGGRGASLPAQLSGGQQQRVALARALVFGPDVLLMDEPLGALDRAMREEMKIELKRIQRELDVTVVYVTHDQSEAMAMADRVGVMHEGRLQQVAPPEELYSTPRTGFIARFVGDASLVDAQADAGGVISLAGEAVEHQGWDGPAGPVQLALRPAGVRVTAAGRGLSGIAATVEATFYLGASWRVTVRLPDGQLAQGSAESGPFVRGLTPGDPVRISWPADAATPLAPAPAALPTAPLPQK